MNRFLIIGDTHGDIDGIARAVDHAARIGATIISLGDFGFMWTGRDGDQIGDLEELLERSDVNLLWIDGNHDHHPWIATLSRCGSIGAYVSPHITHMPRGSYWRDEDGTGFLFLGGAPSIDRAHRTLGVSYWDEEVISEDDVENAIENSDANEFGVDVMITHDSPVLPTGIRDNCGTPWFRAQAPRSRDALARVAKHYLPKLLCHGHYHLRHSAELLMPSRDDDVHAMRIEGLDHSGDDYEDFIMEWDRSCL